MDTNERRIVGLTMAGHGLVHTYELSIPVLIPIWMGEFSVTASTIGIAVAIGYGLFGFGSLPAGFLSDLHRSKPLIVACFFGMGAAFIGLSQASGLLVVAGALLLWGGAASLYHPAGLSLLSRGVTARGRALGYHGIAGNIGIALGPFVTILVLLVADWRAATFALALPAVAAGVIAWRLPVLEPDRAVASDRPGQVDAAPAGVTMDSFPTHLRRTFTGLFIVVFAIVVFEGLYYRGALTFLPDMLATLTTLDPVDLFGRSVPPERYLYVGLLLTGILGQYLGGWVSDLTDPALGVGVAYFGLLVVALLFIPATKAGFLAVLLVSALLGFLLFFEQPLLQATVADHSHVEVRGLSYGLMYVGVFGVGALGAAISGVLLDLFDADAVFAFLALIGLGATLTALYVYRYG